MAVNASYKLWDGTSYVEYLFTPRSHAHDVVTTSVNGFMSAEDKTKLNGIAVGANAYTHPDTSGNKHIPSGGSSGQILRWSADGTAVWGSDNNTTYTLSSFGVTASAAELNFTDGVTSNIQTQLNGKAAESHTHTVSQITDFVSQMFENSKIKTSLLPDSVLGQLEYCGVFDAFNASAGGSNYNITRTSWRKGDYVIVNNAGTLLPTADPQNKTGAAGTMTTAIGTNTGWSTGTNLEVGDWLVHNGGTDNNPYLNWDKVDNTDAVSAVAGLTGNISAASLANALKGTTSTTLAAGDHTHTFANLTNKPTTLYGYGITDAKIASGVITLGSNTITPLTAITKAQVEAVLTGEISSHSHSAYSPTSHNHNSNYNKVTVSSTQPTAVSVGDVWICPA